jgi:hypothetical protein
MARIAQEDEAPAAPMKAAVRALVVGGQLDYGFQREEGVLHASMQEPGFLP